MVNDASMTQREDVNANQHKRQADALLIRKAKKELRSTEILDALKILVELNKSKIMASVHQVLTIMDSDDKEMLLTMEMNPVGWSSGWALGPKVAVSSGGERYNLQDYRGGRNPRNLRELFNYGHSLLRNVIEQCFGVLKARFPILKAMPTYPVSVQKFIVVATCIVHNFLRQEVQRDNLFNQFENEELMVDDGESVVDDAPDPDRIVQAQSQQEMEKLRDNLANAMFNAYNRGGVQNYRQQSLKLM
ncbi:hypothetical protein L1049_002696 [Liquidambar formosana]|uniref:DDE Tnp4 domain-containing protein n=1 Tax=Liquidambar formosana TaxID=63359 RepID=A0AAP0R7M2_LIQFO